MTLEDAIAGWEESKRKAKEAVIQARKAVQAEVVRATQNIANAPAPVMMERFADGDGFVDREAYPIFVERITMGSVIFSQSYASDAWLYLKNNHLILSILLAHPKHPFSKAERLVCLFCSVIMGFGLTCAFNLITKEPTKTILSVVIGGLIQGIYDALLRVFAECLCVQGCPRCIVKCFELCGRVGMVLQFLLGCVVLCIGLVAFLTEMPVAELGGVTWRFGLSKAASWLVASLLFCFISYHFARRSQMRPASARRSFKEKEAHEKWNTPQDPWCCCCSCFITARAPSYFWNHYIGNDVHFEDLPERAPRYAIKVLCCSCGSDTATEASV